MTSSVKTVFAEEFSKNYEFYKEYDDVVMHKKIDKFLKPTSKMEWYNLYH